MSENNNQSDKEIILKVVKNDSKALEELYDRYSPVLFTLINKIVQQKSAAEDLLSDVFVIIWQKIDRFDSDTGNVYTWMINLTRNKAIDFVKRNRNPEEMEEYSDEYEIKNIIPNLSPSAEAMDLDKVLSMKEKINDSFNKLTDAQQYVLKLAYYQGYNEQEIASELNIPLPTVKSKISIALGNLNKNLATEE
ncbi:MAG: sigma-70 family RNA polymerase sigma factor [Ignavibacteriaceae bacterium]|nr:sigma-70 family RNA polymerase sigma factor [Ignavibacteriaceae bacterium]